MKILAVVLFILFVMLQVKLWSADGGLREVWLLEKRLTVQVEANQQRQQRNDTLSAEVKDLKSGLIAIEERARSELGMIRKGETFIQVVNKTEDELNNDK